jgi:hypothetical protein
VGLLGRFTKAAGIDRIGKAAASAIMYVAKHELATFGGLLNLVGGVLFFLLGVPALFIDNGRTALGVVLCCVAFPSYWILCVGMASREAERTQHARGGRGRGR